MLSQVPGDDTDEWDSEGVLMQPYEPYRSHTHPEQPGAPQGATRLRWEAVSSSAPSTPRREFREMTLKVTVLSPPPPPSSDTSWEEAMSPGRKHPSDRWLPHSSISHTPMSPQTHLGLELEGGPSKLEINMAWLVTALSRVMHWSLAGTRREKTTTPPRAGSLA